MQKGDDPYEILGVETDASTSDIRKAYRKLAVVHHPDKQATEEGREKAHHIFARIACAYELLSDEEKRKEYDEQQDEAPEEEHPGFDGNCVYDYDFTPSDPDCTALALPTEKTGKSFNPFKKKPKKKKPFHFTDPYEVFKRAFKEEFGYEYPGAKWDNIEKTGKDVHNRAKNAPLALENGGVGDKDNAAANNAGGEGEDKKKKGGILALFKRKKDDQQLTVYKGDGKTPEEKPGYKQPPGNNRPTSMETKTTQIEHDDGTIETITETTITRPDGSTETMRQTDKPEKATHDWTKPKEKEEVKKLTNGEKQDQKMLTDGKQKGKAPPKNQKKLTNGDDKKKKEKPKAITNG